MENNEINETSSEQSDESLSRPTSRESMILMRKALSMSSMFSGPLPPPEMLKAYDLVEPGLAREIFDMAKKQSQHRIEMEKTVISGDNLRSWAGLVSGFILACICIGCSSYLILKGHDIPGTALAGTTLVSLVSSFIYGTNQRSQERIQNQKALLEANTDDEK